MESTELPSTHLSYPEYKKLNPDANFKDYLIDYIQNNSNTIHIFANVIDNFPENQARLTRVYDGLTSSTPYSLQKFTDFYLTAITNDNFFSWSCYLLSNFLDQVLKPDGTLQDDLVLAITKCVGIDKEKVEIGLYGKNREHLAKFTEHMIHAAIGAISQEFTLGISAKSKDQKPNEEKYEKYNYLVSGIIDYDAEGEPLYAKDVTFKKIMRDVVTKNQDEKLTLHKIHQYGKQTKELQAMANNLDNIIRKWGNNKLEFIKNLLPLFLTFKTKIITELSVPEKINHEIVENIKKTLNQILNDVKLQYEKDANNKLTEIKNLIQQTKEKQAINTNKLIFDRIINDLNQKLYPQNTILFYLQLKIKLLEMLLINHSDSSSKDDLKKIKNQLEDLEAKATTQYSVKSPTLAEDSPFSLSWEHIEDALENTFKKVLASQSQINEFDFLNQLEQIDENFKKQIKSCTKEDILQKKLDEYSKGISLLEDTIKANLKPKTIQHKKT